MKTKILLKRSSILMIAAISLITSCNEEERITAQDSQDISEEAVTDSYFQDMDDMAGVAVEAPSDTEYNGGRTQSTFQVSDSRFRCDGAPLTLTLTRGANSTPSAPNGVITVDFGTGCTDLRGNTRSGKLIFAYNGRRFMPNSTVVVTGQNYTVNGVKLEGTRTLTNVTGSTDVSPKFNAVLTGGKAIFEDNSQATRESSITWQWVRGTTPADDKLYIDQSSTASGTTRAGRNYQVSLLEQLQYNRFCGIAVSGIKRYVINGEKEITVDYGNGDCDKEITVTVNGVVRNIRVN
ncbi:MAG TPA: hypothetical protein VGD65_02685 [Chryseosolibacter sp.]